MVRVRAVTLKLSASFRVLTLTLSECIWLVSVAWCSVVTWRGDGLPGKGHVEGGLVAQR